MQKWLDNKNILMYSAHNEGKSVIAERDNTIIIIIILLIKNILMLIMLL